MAGRVILNNNAYMVINKGAYLVIDTPSTNGIMTLGSGGNIISESDTNRVKWNIGTATGTYIIPFSYTNGNKIPFTFNVTLAGTGNGNLTASTYYTNVLGTPNNRPLPIGVTNLFTNGSTENDVHVVDRFWKIDVNGYTANPTASLIFTYRDEEWNTSGSSRNTITEANLQAQRWAGGIWHPPLGSVNTTANTVTVSGISTFSPWTLVDNDYILPIKLLSFDARWFDKNNKRVILDWKTASETNNDYFLIERSINAINFYPIIKTYGQGTTTKINYYTEYDDEPFVKGISYYRLKQVDFDGSYAYSQIVALNVNKQVELITIFPNPAKSYIEFIVSTAEATNANIRIVDDLGQVLYSEKSYLEIGYNKKTINLTNFARGNYILQISTEKNAKTEKTFIVR